MKLEKKDFNILFDILNITGSMTSTDDVKLAEKLIRNDGSIGYFIDSVREKKQLICYNIFIYDEKIELNVYKEKEDLDRYTLSILRGKNDGILFIENSNPKMVYPLEKKFSSFKEGFPDYDKSLSLDDLSIKFKERKKENK